MAFLRTGSPPALDRALTILEAVANSAHGLRLPEVTRRLGLPKSSAHALLVTLERRGYLQRNEKGQYIMTARILALANVALCNMPLREAAYEVLVDLTRRTDLAAKFAILDRDQAVLIEQVQPPHAPASMTWLGKRLDLHCTALGKVLIAFQPRLEWSRLISEHGLPRHNANTICTAKGLVDELTATCERGYAFDDEEFILGMRCVAVPLPEAATRIPAAIGVTGPAVDIQPGNVPSLGRLLREAAARIAERLASQQDT